MGEIRNEQSDPEQTESIQLFKNSVNFHCSVFFQLFSVLYRLIFLQKLQVFYESWETCSYRGENLRKNSHHVNKMVLPLCLWRNFKIFVESDLDLTRFVLVYFSTVNVGP